MSEGEAALDDSGEQPDAMETLAEICKHAEVAISFVASLTTNTTSEMEDAVGGEGVMLPLVLIYVKKKNNASQGPANGSASAGPEAPRFGQWPGNRRRGPSGRLAGHIGLVFHIGAGRYMLHVTCTCACACTG